MRFKHESDRMSRTRRLPVVRWLGIGLFSLSACAPTKTPLPTRLEQSLLAGELRQEIRNIAGSVVGINTYVRYKVHQYHYLQKNGKLQRDPNSPVGYRLDVTQGDGGVFTTKDEKNLSGGGLIIHFDPSRDRYVVLTSSHLVSPRDTTDVYYLDERGRPTDVVFTRYVISRKEVTLRAPGNWQAKADLLFGDSANDLAILVAESENKMGDVFPNPVGYGLDLSWGDWVFLFGYPKGIKQLSGGWVSPAPYHNALTVDAVVRFGFSGGPVFAVLPGRSQLAFVGLIKSVPSTTLEYVAPDGTLPSGYPLTAEDIEQLYVKTQVLVEYGTAYFVRPKIIRAFFNRARAALEYAGIQLDPKYYGTLAESP